MLSKPSRVPRISGDGVDVKDRELAVLQVTKRAQTNQTEGER